jgi:DNA-binding NarL/FixJ family response regulator
MDKKTRIYIIDNENIAIESLQINLSILDWVEIVGSASEGARAVADLGGGIEADIVIMDLFMRPMDGFKTMTAIKEKNPYKDIRFIFYSFSKEWGHAVKAIELGANGYIVRDSSIKELFNAIERTIQDANNVVIDARITRPSSVPKNGTVLIPDFTARELTIMKLVQSGKSSVEIAKQVFNAHHSDAPKLKELQTKVETYISEIKRKSNTKNKAHLIRYVLENRILPNSEIYVKNRMPEPYRVGFAVETEIPFVVIDDHTNICEGIPRALEALGHSNVTFAHVGSYMDGGQAIKAIRDWAATRRMSHKSTKLLIILDIQIPKGLSGEETAAQLSTLDIEPVVVVLTSYDNHRFARKAVKLGPDKIHKGDGFASAYVLKDMPSGLLGNIILNAWAMDSFSYIGVVPPADYIQDVSIEEKIELFVMEKVWDGLEKKEIIASIDDAGLWPKLNGDSDETSSDKILQSIENKPLDDETKSKEFEKIKKRVYQKTNTESVAELINYIWRSRLF